MCCVCFFLPLFSFVFKLCVTRLMSFNMNMEIIKEKQKSWTREKELNFYTLVVLVVAWLLPHIIFDIVHRKYKGAQDFRPDSFSCVYLSFVLRSTEIGEDIVDHINCKCVFLLANAGHDVISFINAKKAKRFLRKGLTLYLSFSPFSCWKQNEQSSAYFSISL